MSHKNYTKYSKMNNGESTQAVSEPIVETNPIVTENESAVIEQPIEGQIVIPEVAPTVEPEIRKIGKVIDCKKLNVRKLPSPTAVILMAIVEGSELMINEKESTTMFYKVCTEQGIEGYCMKQFIKVLS